MFNGKGQRWASGCLATTRHCFAASLSRSHSGAYSPPPAPGQRATGPSGPTGFPSLSWAAGHSFCSFQMGKTRCQILEYANAYALIFSDGLWPNFPGSSFGQFYLSVFIPSPCPL